MLLVVENINIGGVIFMYDDFINAWLSWRLGGISFKSVTAIF